MKSLRVYIFALGFFLGSWIPAHAVEPQSPGQATADSAASNVFLLKVVFDRVFFISAGDIAHYTSLNQNIRFQVFVSELVNVNTQENLLNGPDAFFAIPDLLFTNEGPAKPFQFCLDMIREMAFNSNSGAKMLLFVNVRNVTGVNFVVRAFHSCELQPGTS